MELTQEQIDTLRKKGLSDVEISSMAQERGMRMPAPKILDLSQVKSLRDNGLSDDEITSLAKEKGYSIQSEEQPGFIKSTVQSIASPFLKLASTGGVLLQGAKSIREQIMGDTESSQKSWEKVEKMQKEGVDYGYLGNVKPLGTTGGFRDVIEAIGTGAEIGSYAVSGGGTAGVLKGTLKNQILKTAAKEAAVGGASTALMMGGVEAQRPDSTIGSIAERTAVGGLVGTVGGAVLGGVTPVVAKAVTSTPAKILINKILPQNEKRITTLEQSVLDARRNIAEQYQKTFPLTPSQQIKEQNLLDRTGDNIYTTLAKNDIDAGSPKAITQLQDISNMYSDVINRAKANETNYFNIDETINNAVNSIDGRLNSEIAKQQARDKVLSEIQAVLEKNKKLIIQDVNGNNLVPVEIMEQLRKIGNDLTPFNASDPMRIGKSAGYSLADAVRDQVEKQGSFASYREANREWGKIIHAQEILQDLIDSGKTWKLPGMFGGLSGATSRRILSGVLGFRTGGIGGAVLSEMSSEAAAKVLANPSFRTYLDRKVIELSTQKQSHEIIKKLANEIESLVNERGANLKLPPAPAKGQVGNPIITTPPKDFGSKIEVIPAQKTSPTRNPKTGKMQTTYLSTPKSTEQIAPANIPKAKQASNTIKKTIPQSSPDSKLLQEAKKYKSAEEFIKKQPIVYHGSQTPLKKFSNEQGTFFTDDMMNAEGYAGGENVYEGYLNLKNPLIIDAKGALHRELNTKWGKTTQEIVGKVDKTKYDGVIFKNIKDSWIDDAEVDTPSTIYYAFKPKDTFLNKSQLTDIYNQAHGIIKKK